MAAKKQGQKRKSPHVQQSNQPKKNMSISAENRPLLSIGMIFRDDIRCIERCLQALQPLREAVPCQLVMADTGSVDGSRTVAERYADLVIDFPWINDFAAARNAAVDRCTGVWCLTVDTDEYLDEDFTQLVDFLRDPASLQYDCAFITVRNYQSEDMPEGDYGDFSAGRMVRMDTGMRYAGAIHESWTISTKHQLCDLLRVVFHHDGYSAEKRSQKQKRNMPLLKQALEQAPGDMRRIMQCIESCYTKEDAWTYSKMAVDCAEEFQRTYSAPNRDHILAAALRGAIGKAAQQGFHELAEWVALSRRLVPDSILIDVDASYHYCTHLSHAGKAEQCLEELTRYWTALERFDTGAFDQAELRASIIQCASPRTRQAVRLIQADSLLKLKRWDEALETLSLLQLSNVVDTKNIAAALVYLFRIWRESDVDCFPLFLRNLEGIAADDSNASYQRQETFFSACRDAFHEEEADAPAVKRKTHQLFLPLEETHDLGRAARIMETHDAETIRTLLGGVTEWKFFPTEAIDRALELWVLPPEEFYRQKTEVLNFHAAKLVGLHEKDTLSMLKLWDERLPSALTVYQVMWLFYLTAAAVQKENWKRKGSLELFDLFREKTASYLDTFCRPELCTEEFIQLQPTLVRFGWFCMQAGNAWDANDPVEYTRWLKKALSSAPEMRDMVQFLLKRAKNLAEHQSAVSPELLALANQVRMILSAYPADHPAVLAIKQSEAYQQVAYLLS